MGVPTYPTQDWTEDLYESTHVADTDLQNIELNFATLKNSFAGTSAPANAEAGLAWFDTTKKIMKIRNQADSAWLGVMYGTTSYKVWVYINAAGDGWVIDSSVTDRVLALKGGAQAYNVSGATQAGSWTQPNSTLSVANLPSHNHGGATGLDGIHSHMGIQPFGDEDQSRAKLGTGGPGDQTSFVDKSGYVGDPIPNEHSHTISSQGSGTAHDHGTSYRPYAAVGTLQYPNV